MHIHYLSTSHLISDTANAVHVMKMCQAFAQLGHRVTLHGYRGDGNLSDIHPYYGTHTEFEICLYNEQDRKSGLSAILWQMREAFPFLKVGGIPSWIFSKQNLAPLFKALSEDTVIYGRNLYWLYALSPFSPFIAERHHPPKNMIEKYIEKHLYRRKNCRSVVVISAKLKEIYLSIHPELKNKIIVAHDGADDSGARLQLRPHIRQVGYVGHLYQGRGAEVIIEIARQLPDIEFHLVGGQEEMIDAIRASTPDMPGNIVFHGHQPHSSLANFYKNFDVVLAPYQYRVAVGGNRDNTAAFMSPLKIFEYMSYGLPIICSDLPVLREVLKNGTNALLVAPDKPELWVEAIRWLEENEEERQKISQNSYDDFQHHHTWLQRAKHILEESNLTKIS